MTVTTASARHLLFRLTQPGRLPEAIHAVLRDEIVLTGWMRASGVLSDVQIRVGASTAPRSIPGVVQVIALEGSIGLADGDVSCGLRAVLAQEKESGLETIAGELVAARIETLEVYVTAFDDVTATRQLDPAGVWVLDPTAAEAASAEPVLVAAPPVTPSPLQSGFSEVVRAAEAEQPPPARPASPAPPAPPPPRAAARPSPTFSSPMNQAMPQRIARPPQVETEDDPVPEPGDTVDHFAFGQCEVVKSDGDRLHVRLVRDQRIKEIALQMLKVTPLPPAEGATTSRHWKLARKL